MQLLHQSHSFKQKIKTKKAVNILTTFGKNLIKTTKHRDMIHLWIVTAEGDPMIYLS